MWLYTYSTGVALPIFKLNDWLEAIDLAPYLTLSPARGAVHVAADFPANRASSSDGLVELSCRCTMSLQAAHTFMASENSNSVPPPRSHGPRSFLDHGVRQERRTILSDLDTCYTKR